MAADMKYGDYLTESIEIFKANLVNCLLASFLGLVPFLNFVVFINLMAGFKAAKHEGKPIEIGDLLNFENVGDKILGGFLWSLAFGLCLIPGALVLFALPILADKPGIPFMNALQGALQFGKANLVDVFLLSLVLAALVLAGTLCCGLGSLLTMPVTFGMLFLAYEDHKAGLEAAAAEGGIAL